MSKLQIESLMSVAWNQPMLWIASKVNMPNASARRYPHKSAKPSTILVPLSPYATITVLDINYSFAAYIVKHNRSKYAHKRFQWMPFACSN